MKAEMRPSHYARALRNIKLYAVELAATITFLAWLGSTVWREVSNVFIALKRP